METTIAIIAACAMGSAIDAKLTGHGITVLTSLKDRSASSRSHAEARRHAACRG
jgi:3-hydroxyacyl-CoA dehydrogenase